MDKAEHLFNFIASKLKKFPERYAETEWTIDVKLQLTSNMGNKQNNNLSNF